MSRLPMQHRFPTRATSRPRRRATAVVGLALVSVVALAGCDDKGDQGSARPAPRTSSAAAPTSPATAESTPAEEPSSAAPSSPATSSAAPAPTPVGLSGRLPSAQELPGFNQQWRWTAGATRKGEGTKLFGTCERFALESIGATEVVRRDYRSASDPADTTDTGGALVAELPDSATARRAYAVLTSWRKQCADRLPDGGKVGALQGVDVAGGSGDWYLLTYPQTGGSPDEQFFDAQGMAIVGNRIALVSLRLLGQDYDYAPGQEPMVAAVRLAGGKLG